jgi:hypothetical protein
MTADTVLAEIIRWMRLIALVLLLITLVVVLLRSFGVSIPLRGLGHVELAYLAGAYWLTR